jgi:hypothetical protein
MSMEPICFGIGLRLTLDKSYSNSYEHSIYISLDGRNSPLFSSLKETDKKNEWTKNMDWNFASLLLVIDYRLAYNKPNTYLVSFRSKTRFHSVASIAYFYVVVSNGNKYQVVRIILRPIQRSLCQLLSLLQFHINQTFSVKMSVSHFRVFLVHQINPSTHTTRSSSWYFQPHPQDA